MFETGHTDEVDLQLEEILAEGKRFEECRLRDILEKRKRARIAVVSIRDLISDIDQRVKFRSFFIDLIFI